MHEQGRGGAEQSAELALKYTKEAVEAGEPHAIFNLGTFSDWD